MFPIRKWLKKDEVDAKLPANKEVPIVTKGTISLPGNRAGSVKRSVVRVV